MLMRHPIATFFLAGLSLAFTTTGQADTEIYIGLNEAPEYSSVGSPPDESNTNVLRAVSWTAGGSNSSDPGDAGTRNAITTLTPITIIREGDAKAGQLIAKAATSALFETVYITTFNTNSGIGNGNTPLTVTQIKLDNVAVGSFTISDSNSNDRRLESATFAYECITYQFFIYDPDTGDNEGSSALQWNRKLRVTDEDC